MACIQTRGLAGQSRGASTCSSSLLARGRVSAIEITRGRSPACRRVVLAAAHDREPDSEPFWRQPVRPAAAAASAAAACCAALLFAAPGSAPASDFIKTGFCLLGNCQVQLAQCITDINCAQNILCLNNCNGHDDETECQIRCGDLYGGKAVEVFNKCAVSDKGCVEQRVDETAYPTPDDSALANNFDINNFTGRWNITAGQNTLFDTFDCQVHDFDSPKPNFLHGQLRWRIQKSNGDFISRAGEQTFNQDPEKPAYLRNDNNEFLNYTDDWYIIGFKPDKYAVVYYKGNNDAWKGYGGVTVYTKDKAFNKEYTDDVAQAMQKVGLKWSDMRLVDNTCKPHTNPGIKDRILGGITDLNPQETNPDPSPFEPMYNAQI